jgi:hypothetical protein
MRAKCLVILPACEAPSLPSSRAAENRLSPILLGAVSSAIMEQREGGAPVVANECLQLFLDMVGHCG